MPRSTRQLEIRSYHGSSPVAGQDIIGRDILIGPRDVDVRASLTVDPLSGTETFIGFNLARQDSLLAPTAENAYTYSYVKNLRCHAISGVTFLGNIRIWFQPSLQNMRGIGVYVQQQAGYVNPVSQASSPLSGFTNNIFQYTEDSPLILTANTTTAGAFGNYLQLQVRVSAYARPGSPAGLKLFAAWDEWEIP